MRQLLFFSVFLMVGCGSNINKDDLKFLNGYWQISEVNFVDGNKKEYPKLSTTIDYISWSGTEGFRKKVQPRLNGAYSTSDDAEAFEIEESKGRFTMRYKNDMSEWRETLVALGADTFSVINESGVTYRYTRFESFDLEP